LFEQSINSRSGRQLPGPASHQCFSYLGCFLTMYFPPQIEQEADTTVFLCASSPTMFGRPATMTPTAFYTTAATMLVLLGAVLQLSDMFASRRIPDVHMHNPYLQSGMRGKTALPATPVGRMHSRLGAPGELTAHCPPGLAGRVHSRQGRFIMQHASIRSAATVLRCSEAVGGVSGLGKGQNGLQKGEVLLYQSDQQKPLLLHTNTSEILGYILNYSGEAQVHQLFLKLFTTVCQDGTGLFLDVGANAGFYSLAALSNGCQALMFDPQPACVELIQHQLCLNSYYPNIGSGLGVGVIDRPVSAEKQSLTLTEWQPAEGARCAGSYSVDVHVRRTTSPVRQFVRETVILDELLLSSGLQLTVVKIDTEGFEVQVLRSMRRLLQAKRVSHMVVEVTPVFWKRDGISRQIVYQEFEPLLGLGCRMGRVMDVNLTGAVPVIQQPLDTPEKLRHYLVDTDFVQEDLYVKCLEEHL
jgi:FkbM family methyltransferase